MNTKEDISNSQNNKIRKTLTFPLVNILSTNVLNNEQISSNMNNSSF